MRTPGLTDVRAELARRHYLDYMRFVWQRPRQALMVGVHTQTIAERIDRAFADFRNGRSTYLCIKVPFRHGKALALDTAVPTPQGWSTIGEIGVGDALYGADGRVCRVVAKSPVHECEVFEINIDSGRETLEASPEHLWRSKLDRRQPRWGIYDTTTLARKRRFSVPLEVCGRLCGSGRLPVQPYTLGYWLGNGHSRFGRLCCGRYDIAQIRAQVEADGYHVTPHATGTDLGVAGLTSKLAALNLLGNKHIPSRYLRAAAHDRLSLLQGLVDSDGEVGVRRNRPGRNEDLCGGEVTFGSTTRALADGVVELVRSLGIKASLTRCRAKLNGIDYGVFYKVTFYMRDCARLVRKAERTRNAQKFILHSMRVSAAGRRAPMRCLQVDSEDGMFLVGRSMVPTHNSDLVSRYLPPRFLGEWPDHEVIVAGYSASLVRGFSRFARNLFRDSRYRTMSPGVSLSSGDQSIDHWGVHDTSNPGQDLGGAHWVGLGGSITGKGGSLVICDDFFKGREEAESEVLREKVWDSLTNDLLTRCAATCIVIILATPWHVDDPFGRIAQRMALDPAFPRFEEMIFPAFSDDYPGGVLFPERFPREWYENRRAILGPYGTASLLQCAPTLRSGNMLRTDKIRYYQSEPPYQDIAWVRGWDIASSEKQRVSENPDYTCGVKLGVRWHPTDDPNEQIPELFFDDMVLGKWEALQRNKVIRDTAIADGEIPVTIEGYGIGKDAHSIVQAALKGLRRVEKVQLPGDKVTRAGAIEPAFAAGNVWLRVGPWNNEFLKFIREFPGGAHDDPVDAGVTAFAGHRPFARRIMPNVVYAVQKQFNIDWAKASSRASLHYVGAFLSEDLVLYVVGLLWDDLAEALFIYDAWESADLEPVGFANQLVTRQRLKTYDCQTIAVNTDMVSDRGEVRTLAKGINAALRKAGARQRLREAFRYDRAGAVAMVNELASRKKLWIHSGVPSLYQQLSSWSVVNGKPAVGSCEYCHAVCLAVSELRRRLPQKAKRPQPPDYKRVRNDVVEIGARR